MFKNRTIKRVTAVIGAVLTLFLFAGCSTDGGRAGGGDDQVQVAVVQHMDHPSLNEIKETIISTFEELGMDNVEVIEKNANGDMSLLPSIMQSLVSDGVDYIVPIATPTAQAAIAATTTVPIVFSAVSNPVEAGLVSALDQTTGNVTGVSNAIPVEDIIDLARTMQPDLKTLGFVYNTSEINSVTGIENAKKYCDENGIAYKEATISSTADLQQAAASIAGEIGAFFTPNDNMVASAMQTYLGVANGAGA